MGLELWQKLLIGAVVVSFLAVSYLWKKPVTHFGRIALRLSIVNVIGWVILLFLPDGGHPPLWLFPLHGFWLLNLILLPAITVVLWMCRREREERKSFLAISLAYLLLNVIVLFIVPLVWGFKSA